MNGVNVKWGNFDLHIMNHPLVGNLTESIVTACTYRNGKIWTAHPDCVFLAIF